MHNQASCSKYSSVVFSTFARSHPDFLQIPPHDGHWCISLVIITITNKVVAAHTVASVTQTYTAFMPQPSKV